MNQAAQAKSRAHRIMRALGFAFEGERPSFGPLAFTKMVRLSCCLIFLFIFQTPNFDGPSFVSCCLHRIPELCMLIYCLCYRFRAGKVYLCRWVSFCSYLTRV